MKRLILTGALFGMVGGLAGLLGCDSDPAPPPPGPGGIQPGKKAAEASVARLLNRIELEQRDRVFMLLDTAYEPVLKSFQGLDASRKRLIKALRETSQEDLALILGQKQITSAPELIEIVVGRPKQSDFNFAGETALMKLELPMPDGKRKEAWVKITRDDVRWRVAVPFADSPDAKPSGQVPKGVLADADKAVAGMKKVMDDLSTRLEKGEMIEATTIREKLSKAGRPLAAVVQRIIYGQTNIK